VRYSPSTLTATGCIRLRVVFPLGETKVTNLSNDTVSEILCRKCMLDHSRNRVLRFLLSIINNKYKRLEFIHSVNGYGSKTTEIITKVILPTITSPECQRDAQQYYLFIVFIFAVFCQNNVTCQTNVHQRAKFSSK